MSATLRLLGAWSLISVCGAAAGPSTTLAHLPNTGINAVKVDAAGNIYIAGFQGTVRTPDSYDAFVAKLSPEDMARSRTVTAATLTRALFLGTPTARMKRVYRAVLEAQLAAVATVRAGVSTAAVDRVARKVLQGYGLDSAFVYSTGHGRHGLGLEIHEPPRLGKRDKARLQVGMAITIEPGVYGVDLFRTHSASPSTSI
jgi:hypothetical protein